jgi:hypothetical protein
MLMVTQAGRSHKFFACRALTTDTRIARDYRRPAMDTRTRTVGAVGFVGVLGVLAALTPAGRAIAQDTRALLVEVVNTPDVRVSGPVTIGNGPANPVPIVDLAGSARQPFRAHFFCITLTTCTETLAVPTGRLLLIETYSANCAMDPAVKARSSIEIPNPDNPLLEPLKFFFPLELSVIAPAGFGGSVRHQEMTAAVRLYADPGTQVSFRFTKSPTSQAMVCEGAISGLLLDCAGPTCGVS